MFSNKNPFQNCVKHPSTIFIRWENQFFIPCSSGPRYLHFIVQLQTYTLKMFGFAGHFFAKRLNSRNNEQKCWMGRKMFSCGKVVTCCTRSRNGWLNLLVNLASFLESFARFRITGPSVNQMSSKVWVTSLRTPSFVSLTLKSLL